MTQRQLTTSRCTSSTPLTPLGPASSPRPRRSWAPTTPEHGGGLRTGVTIDRRAADLAPANWSAPPVGDGPEVTVVDLGLAVPQQLPRLAMTDRGRLVVVCRPTVPGVRLADQLLGQLAPPPAAIAAIGPSRWPGEVTASLGPRLRVLRAAGRVVPVPMDRRLEITCR